jgi:hypothetical protein
MRERYQTGEIIDGVFHDKARVEMDFVGPDWLNLLRFRFYMDHKPEDHVTILFHRYLGKVFGSWNPPYWLINMFNKDTK